MNKEQVIFSANEAGVRLIRLLYCDNGCVIRGKSVPIDSLANRLESGIGLTVAMQAMNMLDNLQPVEGMGPVGEIRLVPDPQSFVVLPYAPHSAAMMCDMIALDQQPWSACPRSFLKRMIGRAAAQGLHFQATIENEFSLLRPGGDGGFKPIDVGLCFSSVSMTAAAEVMNDIIAALEEIVMAILARQKVPRIGIEDDTRFHTFAAQRVDDVANRLQLRLTALPVHHV